MGVEMTRASSCSSLGLLGDTSPQAEGWQGYSASSGQIRDLPKALAGGGRRGRGSIKGVGSPRGFLQDQGGCTRPAGAPALPGV